MAANAATMSHHCGELDCSHHAQNACAVCELNVVFFECQCVCVLSFLSHESVVLSLCSIQNAMLMRMRHLKLTVAVSVLRSDSTDAGMWHVGGCAFSMLLSLWLAPLPCSFAPPCKLHASWRGTLAVSGGVSCPAQEGTRLTAAVSVQCARGHSSSQMGGQIGLPARCCSSHVDRSRAIMMVDVVSETRSGWSPVSAKACASLPSVASALRMVANASASAAVW